MLGGEDHAQHVDVHDLAIVLDGRVADRAGPFEAGVGEDDVEAAEGLDGVSDHGLDLGLVGDVGLNEGGAAAGLLNQCDGLFAFLLAATGDDDACALLGEGDGGFAADAAGAAGDENDLVGERLSLLAHGCTPM